jgi:diguanylate cyclase (GGDEF)-like protein
MKKFLLSVIVIFVVVLLYFLCRGFLFESMIDGFVEQQQESLTENETIHSIVTSERIENAVAWVDQNLIADDVTYTAFHFFIDLFFILILLMVAWGISEFFAGWERQRLIKSRKELHKKQSLHMEAMSSVNTVFFEYDAIAKKMIISKTFAKQHHLPEAIPSVDKKLLATNIEYEGEPSSFGELLLEIKKSLSMPEREFKAKTIDGQWKWYQITVTNTFNVLKTRKLRALAVVRDVTAEKEAEALLKSKAERDPMTGLYNKAGGINLMSNTLLKSGKDELHALFVLDLDNFKSINDVLGHSAGDGAIIDAGRSLNELFRGTDILCRFGGDEYVAMAVNISDAGVAARKGEEICNALRRTYGEPTHSLKITASVGIALFPNHGTTYQALFDCADAAAYVVKKQGKNNYHIYSAESVAAAESLPAPPRFDANAVAPTAATPAVEAAPIEVAPAEAYYAPPVETPPVEPHYESPTSPPIEDSFAEDLFDL